MRKFNRYRNTILRIIIMSATGCLLIFFAGRYQPVALAPALEAEQKDIKQIAALSKGSSTYFVSRTVDAWADYLDALSGKIESFNKSRQAEEPQEYTPSVLQYNLVRLYPESSDIADVSTNTGVSGETVHFVFNNPSELADLILTPLYQKLDLPMKSKVRDSYGGQMYEYLNRKDAEWTSNLYKWIQATPARATAMKSMAASMVLGKYNPNDKHHKAEDPTTWLIPTWKNVTVNFYDGDGQRTELYSNTQEILSMASVNTYYGDWQNTGDFERYIDNLWNASHSNGTKISKVYYCDGCETPPKSETEATEESKEGITQILEETSGAEIRTEVNASVSVGSNVTQTAPVITESTAAPVSGTTAASTAATGNGSMTGDSAAVESITADSMVADSSAAGGVIAESSEPPGATAVQTVPPSQINPPSSVPETALASQAPAMTESTVASENSSVTPPSAAVSSVPSDTGNQQLTNPPAVNQGIEISPPGVVAQVSVDIKKEPEIILNSEGKFCPGHVDLNITASIIGLSERRNLFSIDKATPYPWNGYMKAYVNELNSMDWSEEYGLSAMELGMGKPLTASEIAGYLNTLPADISAERKTVVSYALNSVGKIPYYYGGKPRASGYENNNFSTPTLPDQKGRVLSGLDCSGWINWVYWSSINKRLSALGTSGLIHEGRLISRSELKPGDILVKPGLNSHVVMFLSWASDNTMVCIHETGGTVSNVTVSTLGTNWPYYRAILE